MQFFKGNGYDEKFTKNMKRVINDMISDPMVEVVSGADVLCECCPNLKDGDCKNCASVGEHDRRVAEICGFSSGDKLLAKDFFAAAQRNIIKAGRMREVCGECSWSQYCEDY